MNTNEIANIAMALFAGDGVYFEKNDVLYTLGITLKRNDEIIENFDGVDLLEDIDTYLINSSYIILKEEIL